MPSRTRKPVVNTRPRSELAVAIIIGVSIVLGVVLLIWLMRPGTPGGVGGGGLFNRQPRISWLTFGALAVGGYLTWWVLRGNRRPARRVSPVLRVIAVWILVIFVYSILALIWPHGIIKHYPSEPKLNPTSTQTTSPVTITAPSTVETPSTTPSKTATTTKATPTTKKP
jgi:hypothetical protein